MFSENFLSDQVENIFNAFGICDKIFKSVLTVNDLGISYRTINSWETSGLMLTERPNSRNWHKFSFVEFAWLNIIFELRQLGFPITKIKVLKEFLSETIDNKVLLEVKRKEARISLNSTNLNRLVLLLAELLYNKTHIALLCNKEGSFYVYNELLVREEKEALDFSQFQFNNFVSVSLTDIIIKYLVNVRFEIISDSKIVDQKYYPILLGLRNKEIQQLCFKIDEEQEIALDPAMFRNYDEFMLAGIRLILTLQFKDLTSC